MTGSISRDDLAAYLDSYLDAPLFSDYAPNGLQIEGRAMIRTLVTGVSANQALIDAAIALEADAILVHHGFFWDKEPRTLTGYRGARVKSMILNDISLFGYHLPLDAHAEVGNNVAILRNAGAIVEGTFGKDRPPIAWRGRLPSPMPRGDVLARLEATLGQPLAFLCGEEMIETIGVVTGGGARWFDDALDAGIDLFISGEPSEQAQGIALERRGNFAAFGHHATERGGVQALGEHIAERFGLTVRFVEVPNPV